MATNSIFTNNIFTSTSIYYKIKLVYIGPGKCYSFPFASATIAIAIAIATAAAAAAVRA